MSSSGRATRFARLALPGLIMAMGVVVAPPASGSRPAAGRPAGHDRADSAAGVRVCAGGDVTLGSNLDTTWIRKMTGLKVDSLPVPDSLLALHMASPDSLVARLRRFVAGADVVLFNAEGAIGDGVVLDPKCHPGHQLCYALRSRAVAASALRTLADTPAVVVANVANNHAHDAGAAGFDLTVALLDSAGVRVTGADTIPTIVTTARGDTVAILGFSAWSDPGVADTAAVRRLVARAAARYGRVIVTAHLGAEGQQAQRTRDSLEQFAGERRGNSVVFAHIAVDAGAGLVIGHGPHVLRAAEWRHGALIFYSLGNLMSYGPFDLREPMARGAVACATIDSAGRPHEVILQPTVQLEPGMVRRDATRRRALALVDSLSRLDFPATGAAVDRVTGAVTSRPRASRAVAPGALNRRRRDR